ncbi:hypothetical protein N7508_011189 [Penicillium antarcticum]|uniref:uncharacterized protein n=1 Tax=Penicillium antarcticum TaxID=416450 RepID=UPI00239B1AD3|nr:uncharacterized protein N7508_011189 [Penicillium antarcticum]KAJ5288414.1 hypothetical protein N7508_011189 [Penicillium antarcticum]
MPGMGLRALPSNIVGCATTLDEGALSARAPALAAFYLHAPRVITKHGSDIVRPIILTTMVNLIYIYTQAGFQYMHYNYGIRVLSGGSKTEGTPPDSDYDISRAAKISASNTWVFPQKVGVSLGAIASSFVM